MRKLFCLLLLVVMGNSAAQQESLHYRADDPFLFCTRGQINEDKCWWPTAPYTGAYIMNPACRPPNPYGRDWTAADWDSLGQYLRVCPQAVESGTWDGRNGVEDQAPFTH